MMITTPTVLVIGAGASIPFDFPSGHKLVSQIIAALAESGDATRMLYYHSIDPRQVERSARG